MLAALNSKQTDKLSIFFFDIAKGVVLGIIGFSVSGVNIPVYLRFINVFLGTIVVYFCVRFGLELIKDD